MTNILDWMGGDTAPKRGEPVLRHRARPVVDPYSLEQIAEDWDNPEVLVLPNAFIASGSSGTGTDEVRRPTSSSAVLTVFDPDADVTVHDRILQGSRWWTVDGVPSNDRHPWSEWQPTLVADLVERTG